MRVRLSADAFQRARASWPNVCCGCGGPASGTYPAYLRRSPLAALATAVTMASGDATWTTFTLRLPGCARCRWRAALAPLAWAALCAVLFVGGLLCMKAGLRFEPDGTPVEGALRTFRLSMAGGFLFATLAGPPLFLILQRWTAPALISDLQGTSWETLESVELDCGSDAFASALR